MATTALLDLHLNPGARDQGFEDELRSILSGTREFEGCLGVDVLIDSSDPSHVVLIERWASEERDAAYRAWRAGEGKTNLGAFLAAPPSLTKCTPATDI